MDEIAICLTFVASMSIAGAKMVQIGRKAATGPKKAKKAQTYVIDCSKPVDDSIMEIAAFEKFLMDKIKVNGKTGAYTIAGCS
jgi:hypothetical protein